MPEGGIAQGVRQRVVRIRTYLIVFGIVTLCANVFILTFLDAERTIYFWDYANYPDKFVRVTGLLRESPALAFSKTLRTVRHDDYNLLVPFFLSPLGLLFGTSRKVFELGLTNLFAVPAILTFISTLRLMVPDAFREKPVTSVFAAAMVPMLLPQLWAPVLWGYVGIAGIIVANIVVALALRRPIERQSWHMVTLLTVLLVLMILIRRWYAYWVAAFFAAFGIARAWTLFRENRFRLTAYQGAVWRISLLGVGSVGVFFAAATPLARRILRTDYGDIYSGFKLHEHVWEYVRQVIDQFGFFIVVLGLLGFLSCLSRKASKEASLFLGVQLLVTFMLFERTQDFGAHHFYLLLPAVVTLASAGVVVILQDVQKRLGRVVVGGGVLAVLVVNWAVVFVPGVNSYLGPGAMLFSGNRRYPVVRQDLGEIMRLVDELKRMSSEHETTYVLGSSGIVNDDILRRACLQNIDDRDFCGTIPVVGHVDKRDGFPQAFFDAANVVVPLTEQYHLRPEDQRIVGVLWRALQIESALGSYYQRIGGSFQFDNGVALVVMRKIGEPDGDALNCLAREFRGYYPERPFLYEISRGDRVYRGDEDCKNGAAEMPDPTQPFLRITRHLADDTGGGQKGSLKARFSSNLEITVKKNVYPPEKHDWWLFARPRGEDGDSLWSFNLERASWLPGLQPVYQGPVVDIQEVAIPLTRLPAGGYLVVFGIDAIANGILDDDRWSSEVEIEIPNY